MFVKFYNMSILLLLVVKLVKITSVQSKIEFLYFLFKTQARLGLDFGSNLPGEIIGL